MVLVAAARRVGTSLFGKDRRRKDTSGYASGRGAMTRKFGGKVYAKVGLFATKAEANAVAKRHRSKGNLARVVKEQAGYCVYSRGG
jgi:hypothetical protein